MKERPILYSGPMVRALLRDVDPKTVTRRAIKPQPDCVTHLHFDQAWTRALPSDDWPGMKERREIRCPYGKPGDRLWVKETWSHNGEAVWSIADARARGKGGVIYRATDPEPLPGCWWPSIFMPREFSRITLEVVGVRVERLQDITEAEAKAEGVVLSDDWTGCAEDRKAFQFLWDSINGRGAWAANPFVWVIAFKRIPQG